VADVRSLRPESHAARNIVPRSHRPRKTTQTPAPREKSLSDRTPQPHLARPQRRLPPLIPQKNPKKFKCSANPSGWQTYSCRPQAHVGRNVARHRPLPPDAHPKSVIPSEVEGPLFSFCHLECAARFSMEPPTPISSPAKWPPGSPPKSVIPTGASAVFADGQWRDLSCPSSCPLPRPTTRRGWRIALRKPKAFFYFRWSADSNPCTFSVKVICSG
jgi:hypothetical protein